MRGKDTKKNEKHDSSLRFLGGAGLFPRFLTTFASVMRRILTILSVLLCLVGCGNGRRGGAQRAVEQVSPVFYDYEVVASYPHSEESYTQGLQWVDGEMWEGTGGHGSSRLMRVDLQTGQSRTIAELPTREFGEGITLLGERIYQLTWQSGIMHIYDRKTLREVASHRYKGEGWGLTTDGQMLYMSDGTPDIRVIDPATMRQVRTIGVTFNGESLSYLNELEWIDGRIWANVYTLDQIVIINPKTGVVEGVVDLTGLLPESLRKPSTDVLNGIAFDAEMGRVFVTGKNWSRLFEIKIFER